MDELLKGVVPVSRSTPLVGETEGSRGNTGAAESIPEEIAPMIALVKGGDIDTLSAGHVSHVGPCWGYDR